MQCPLIYTRVTLSIVTNGVRHMHGRVNSTPLKDDLTGLEEFLIFTVILCTIAHAKAMASVKSSDLTVSCICLLTPLFPTRLGLWKKSLLRDITQHCRERGRTKER